MKILAPCKVNLFLEVKNRRPDGYHNIESIMQAVSLFDELEFKKAEKDITLTTNRKDLPVDERNLIIKAAKVLRSELKVSSGARITLKKRIPMGAGLGGGSSDAAAALKGLMMLWNKSLPASKVSEIAGRIGADVAFFLNGSTAVARGIGNIITPLKTLKKSYFVLVFPNFSIPTPGIYRALRFPLTKKRKINRIKSLLTGKSASSEWGRYIYNRLEEVVFPKYPEIPFIKNKIQSFGYKSLMSGSGSTVFGIVPSLKEAKELKRKLSRNKWRVWVVESLGPEAMTSGGLCSREER